MVVPSAPKPRGLPSLPTCPSRSFPVPPRTGGAARVLPAAGAGLSRRGELRTRRPQLLWAPSIIVNFMSPCRVRLPLPPL